MRRALPAAKLAGVALGVLLVCFLPRFVSDYRASQLALVGVYFIAILGLNILTGYTGQISLGHGAFMAIGGYTTAILVVKHDVTDLWTIPVAGLVAGAFGFAFGIPALRLSGLYLSLATFAVAVATPSVLKKFAGLTGGSKGLQLFGHAGYTGKGYKPVDVAVKHVSFNHWLYYLSWVTAGVLLLVAWLFLRGRMGRAFRAVRDSEVAATSSGVHLASTKTLAFAISAAYAGVAGSLYALANTFVNPDTFPITLSIYLLVGVVVAGLGSLVGIAAGAVFVQFLPIWAQDVSKRPGLPAVIYGAVLILIMFALPTGAAGLLRRLFKPLTSRLYTRS